MSLVGDQPGFLFREVIFLLSQRLGYPDDRYKRLYFTGSVRESIGFDWQSHHAAGDGPVGVDQTPAISAQGRTREIVESADEVVHVLFAPLVEMARLRQAGESGFHRSNLGVSASANVLLRLRRQRLEALLQFEFIEQGDGKRAVAAAGAPLTAGN